MHYHWHWQLLYITVCCIDDSRPRYALELTVYYSKLQFANVALVSVYYGMRMQ